MVLIKDSIIVTIIIIIFNNSYPNSLTPANRTFLNSKGLSFIKLNSGGQCVVTAECSENAVHDFLLQSDLKGQLEMKVSEALVGWLS